MTNTTDTKPTPSRARFLAAVAFAIFCGALVSLQARINGQLGSELGDGFVAAVVSFGSGLVLLGILISFSRKGRSGLAVVTTAVRTRSIPWWYVCGGVAGAFFVLSQGLTAALLGIALFTIAIVAGQTLSGLLVDARGIGTVAPKTVTPQRLVGAAIALVAVAIAVSPELRGDVPLWMLLMPFAVGLVLGWQQAVNGQVKSLAGSALTATFINFLAGTAALVIAAIIHTSIVGWPAQFPTEPWLYVGGIIGMIFIGGFAAIIPVTGVLVQSLAAISGQLLMSLVLDIVAPAEVADLTVATVIGTALTLVAVAVAIVPGSIIRRSRPSGRPRT